MAEVLKVTGLFLRHQDQPLHGPLDLGLSAGEGALILVDDLSLLRGLMRCCLGQDQPDLGRVNWWPLASREPGPSLWSRYDLFRRIGYVDRDCQLLHELTLLDNLTLYRRYARADGNLDRARRLLAELGLAEAEDVPAAALSEPRRRLALYALALNQNPRLMLIERPFQCLDRDFDLVWEIIRRRAREDGLAYAVFDRRRAPYAPEDFKTVLEFAPGQGRGPWT
jgi:ABC-type transport system involved in cytochrome c biogenesis ATPase subunit